MAPVSTPSTIALVMPVIYPLSLVSWLTLVGGVGAYMLVVVPSTVIAPIFVPLVRVCEKLTAVALPSRVAIREVREVMLPVFTSMSVLASE